MKTCRQLGALLLTFSLMLSLGMNTFAAAEDTGFSDVDAGAWYAGAVEYVRDNGLMSGVSDTAFAPDESMTRGMLVTTLYRLAGSPPLANENLGYPFADVPGDAWYADGVYWARLNGVVSGYSDERFGPDDPVTREQAAAILWRYAGSPAAQAGQSFADESEISLYAAQAVDWARAIGIMNGSDGNRFLPGERATRAQVAIILQNYLTADAPVEPAENANVLVVYFSATGNTGQVAEHIAAATGGDLFEIVPAEPYTSADLDWNDENSRVVYEYENPEARDVALAQETPAGWEDYDVVFLGYPIWWGIAAWPVSSFVEANDFAGKTMVPFCTSSSSGLGESGTLLSDLAGSGDWLEGMRFRGGASQADVAAWVESLGLE